MKTIATIIGIAVGIAILIIVGDNLDIIRSAFAQLARLFVEWLTLTLYAATLMFLIVAVVILHTWWRHRRTTMDRQQDGSYALQRHRLPNGAELVVKPDHMIGPAELRAGRPIIHNGTNGPLSASAAPDAASAAGRDGEGFLFEDDPTTDKQAAAFAWMDKHRPNGGTQADMRRAINLSKGYASELWAKWTPSATGAPPPTSSSASSPEPASADHPTNGPLSAPLSSAGRGEGWGGVPHHTIDADDPAHAETLAAIRAAIESGAATINRRK